MKEITALYDSKRISKKYSKKFTVKIQDALVSSSNFIQFIDVCESKKKKTKDFLLSECRDSVILIIGGDDIFPFERTESFVEDGDEDVCTDNWWVSSNTDSVVPEIEISRVPDSIDDDEGSFIKTLELLFKSNKVRADEKAGMTAEIWKTAAENVFLALKCQGEMLSSPPHTVENKLSFDSYEGGLYFNLHGAEDEAGWYGQRQRFSSYREEYPLAILPKNISKGIKNSFLASEACFGAFVNQKKASDSMMLTALKSGVKFCIGSTATAYGTFAPPISEADLLVSLFFTEFLKKKNASLAFLNAKRIFAKKNLEKNGFLDDDDKKTLVEFVMYGNPLTEVSFE
ncbi:MAG: hypothetical protein PHW02_04425 [bacterium]|nr:hypothetical protein [bacterium]